MTIPSIIIGTPYSQQGDRRRRKAFNKSTGEFRTIITPTVNQIQIIDQDHNAAKKETRGKTTDFKEEEISADLAVYRLLRANKCLNMSDSITTDSAIENN